MDLSATFKNEVYRPVVTIVIPGLVALTPYVYLLFASQPPLYAFAMKQTVFTGLVGVLAVIAVGFLLEDLGSLIESRVWEPLQKNREELMEEWYEYLRLSFTTEPVGQKYISRVVMRMKFELSFSLSLVFCGVGSIWLKYRLATGISVVAILVMFGVAAYLLWESFNSSKMLRKIRHELLKGVKAV